MSLAKKKIKAAEPPPLTDRDKHWTQGFTCAVRLAYCEGSLTMDEAKNVVKIGGFDKQDLIDAECEQSDIDAIFPPKEDV